MSRPPNKALREVLDKFNHIGHCFYNGKHFDNALNIFNDMDPDDKLTLLRGVHEIYHIVENGSLLLSPDIVKQPPPKLDGDKIAATVNEAGMQDLKFWFVKVLFLAVMLGLILSIVVVFVISAGGGDSQSLSMTMKILSLLTK